MLMSSALWYQNPSYKTVVWQQNHLEKLPKVKAILGTIAILWQEQTRSIHVMPELR